MDINAKSELTRISISLPERLLTEFDKMLDVRGFDSRSQAISELVSTQVTEHKKDIGQDIMAGTINLVYDHSIPGLINKLADIQHKYINEVISSLHINLVDSQTLEVVLVQGPTDTLNSITDQMLSCRGVMSGKLLISAAILPQLHPMTQSGAL